MAWKTGLARTPGRADALYVGQPVTAATISGESSRAMERTMNRLISLPLNPSVGVPGGVGAGPRIAASRPSPQYVGCVSVAGRLNAGPEQVKSVELGGEVEVLTRLNDWET